MAKRKSNGCPHIRTAKKLIYDKDGLAFCPACWSGPKPDRHVYTGKKIWAGSQVYSPAKLEQKNQDYMERLATRAADTRRRFPSWSVPEE